MGDLSIINKSTLGLFFLYLVLIGSDLHKLLIGTQLDLLL